MSGRDGPVVGIDLGLTSFATLSNGEHIDNPRFFRFEETFLLSEESLTHRRWEETNLAKAQRKLSKTESSDRIKRLKVV